MIEVALQTKQSNQESHILLIQDSLWTDIILVSLSSQCSATTTCSISVLHFFVGMAAEAVALELHFKRDSLPVSQEQLVIIKEETFWLSQKMRTLLFLQIQTLQ